MHQSTFYMTKTAVHTLHFFCVVYKTKYNGVCYHTSRFLKRGLGKIEQFLYLPQ